MSRVYVGNLDSRVTERDLEDEFRVFGVIRSVWVARRPPGYAFIDFDDRRDAQDAIRELDGKNGWRVELSHNSRGGGGGRGRRRSRSPPRFRRSPSYGRRSYSPRGRSPRRRSLSPRGRSYSRSPPYRGREEVPYANGELSLICVEMNLKWRKEMALGNDAEAEVDFETCFIAGNDLVKVVATSMLNRVPDLCRILVVSLQTEVYAFLLF
ncbi:hypothetical protein JHK87_047861 [Glycine soja]|nr:hypothetical protein JHK87_047861 [Glycine soja]